MPNPVTSAAPPPPPHPTPPITLCAARAAHLSRRLIGQGAQPDLARHAPAAVDYDGRCPAPGAPLCSAPHRSAILAASPTPARYMRVSLRACRAIINERRCRRGPGDEGPVVAVPCEKRRQHREESTPLPRIGISPHLGKDGRARRDVAERPTQAAHRLHRMHRQSYIAGPATAPPRQNQLGLTFAHALGARFNFRARCAAYQRASGARWACLGCTGKR